MPNKQFLSCRVCGWYDPNCLLWGKTGEDPSFGICPCCFVEAGNEDYTPESAREYRAKWIAKGAKFHEEEDKPKDWNLVEQLKNIRPDYL